MCIRDRFIIEKPMPNHRTAIEMVMEALQDPEHGVIKSTSEISAIGHRVLHGGTVYSYSIIVNEDVKLSLIHIYMCIRDRLWAM